MKKIALSLVGILTLGVAFGQHQLVKKWETDSVFKVPESVLFDAKNNLLYVANIDGKGPWDKDGKGSIGKMGIDGKIIKVEWVTGLNSPKGMGLHDGKLYVADVDQIVIIDIAKSSIVKTLPIEGAMGLNDVVITPTGVVYVSDSKGKSVYRIEKEKATKLIENLKGPNGVQWHGDKLYLLDDGTMNRVEANGSLIKIAEGMPGGTDGIEQVTGDDFIISCWAGVIWYVKADGTKEKLLDTQSEKRNTADIAFDKKNKIVYVPTFWKNTVAAYQLK